MEEPDQSPVDLLLEMVRASEKYPQPLKNIHEFNDNILDKNEFSERKGRADIVASQFKEVEEKLIKAVMANEGTPENTLGTQYINFLRNIDAELGRLSILDAVKGVRSAIAEVYLKSFSDKDVGQLVKDLTNDIDNSRAR